jgi:two-component sensor histidine kinase
VSDAPAQVRRLLRQQAAIANFGSYALRERDLMKILNEAARICADGLSVPFCKVCRYRPDEHDLLVEAGFGWAPGVIGCVVSRADATSPQGRAFVTGNPAICKDLRQDNEFELPPFYSAHGIVSTIDVIIHAKGEERPYGVLEIDNDRHHDYTNNDINFLTSFANVLAEAVATAARLVTLGKVIEEKERLLEQRNLLARELQHRVRNNMQLVYTMLNRQLMDTTDPGGRRGIKSIARRVQTLGLVHEHLLGSSLTKSTDFANYAQPLCRNIAEVQASSVKLDCDCESLAIGIDMVTSLGIIIAELVTNSYDHAFPNGEGTITVALHLAADDDTRATLVVSDNGTGFTPEPGSKRHELSLVRRLVEQLRGTAKIESDHGTTWTIEFPIPKTEKAVRTTKTPVAGGPAQAEALH